MNKNLKNLSLLIMVLVFLLSTINISAHATEKDFELNIIKEHVYETTYPNGTSPNPTEYNEIIAVKDPTFDGIVDIKGNIIVPSKNEMKERYLKKFNKDPQRYKDSIKNIDSLVNQTINVIEDAKIITSNDLNIDPYKVVASTTKGILSTSYWHIAPYITSSINGITYSTSWVGYDNYRSSVATNCTYNKSITTKKNIGFTGDTKIKSSLGFSWSYEISQTASVTTSTNIPAWTIWDTRPYITWTENQYLGAWTVESYNPLTGITTYSTSSKTGTNIVKRVSNTEAWSATNTARNIKATSPLPPIGAPNVNWR